MSANALAKSIVVMLLLMSAGNLARAQVPIDEAERRLKAKLATRPAGTQPSAEVDRLREDNLRLRERIMSLQQEVTTLKEMMARANPAAPAGATTRPATAEAPGAAGKALAGRWRGGDITAGSSYILQFDPDGTYRQTFVSNNQGDSGQYRVFDDGTLEMWGSKTADDRKHNQYRVSATAAQLTLTPIVLDGVGVKSPKAMVLTKAE